MIPFEFGEEPFDVYSATTVSCAVTKGDLPIEIKWLFDGHHLRTSEGILITSGGQRISMLSIESVQPKHAGVYSCYAKNHAGEARHDAELKVMGNNGSNTLLILEIPSQCSQSYFRSSLARNRLTFTVLRPLAAPSRKGTLRLRFFGCSTGSAFITATAF